jgi:hypothetical protein
MVPLVRDEMLVVKNDVEKRTVDLHPAIAIVNEAQLPEPIHEKANARPSCAHHLGESLLTDLGNYRFGLSVLAEMGKQQKDSG